MSIKNFFQIFKTVSLGLLLSAAFSEGGRAAEEEMSEAQLETMVRNGAILPETASWALGREGFQTIPLKSAEELAALSDWDFNNEWHRVEALQRDRARFRSMMGDTMEKALNASNQAVDPVRRQLLSAESMRRRAREEQAAEQAVREREARIAPRGGAEASSPVVEP